jgi:hypothetical protein
VTVIKVIREDISPCQQGLMKKVGKSRQLIADPAIPVDYPPELREKLGV